MKKLAVAVLAGMMCSGAWCIDIDKTLEKELENKIQLAEVSYTCSILNGYIGDKVEQNRLIKISIDNRIEVANVLYNQENFDIKLTELISNPIIKNKKDFILGLIAGSMIEDLTRKTYDKIYKGAFEYSEFQTTDEIAEMNAHQLIYENNCNILK